MKIKILSLIVILIFLQNCSKDTSNKPDFDSDTAENNESPIEVLKFPKSNYRFTALQNNAINLLLNDSIGFRLADRSDCSNPNLATELIENPIYEPYFKSDDFNYDGKADFAIAIKKDSLICIFWFANHDSTYSFPVFLASANWFDECGFATFDRPGFLGFGRFRSDVGIFFHWNDSLKILEDTTEPEEGV